MSSTEKNVKCFRGQSESDAALIKSLLWLEVNARDDGDDFAADHYAAAAARLSALTEWRDISLYKPDEDDVVTVVVNGQIGGVKLINSVMQVTYVESNSANCWELESFLSFNPGRGDHIEIKYWIPCPEFHT